MSDVGTLVDGSASGRVVTLHEPLSFWGGFNVATGRIIGRHPQRGTSLTGAILVMPSGRGSSSSSSVFAEAIRAGTAPAGVVMAESDAVLALGAIVARELYGVATPVVVVDAATYQMVAAAAEATINPGGFVTAS